MYVPTLTRLLMGRAFLYKATRTKIRKLTQVTYYTIYYFYSVWGTRAMALRDCHFT